MKPLCTCSLIRAKHNRKIVVQCFQSLWCLHYVDKDHITVFSENDLQYFNPSVDQPSCSTSFDSPLTHKPSQRPQMRPSQFSDRVVDAHIFFLCNNTTKPVTSSVARGSTSEGVRVSYSDFASAVSVSTSNQTQRDRGKIRYPTIDIRI